jgi:hypothetical protein
VSHDTLHKAKVLKEKAPEAVKEQLRRGETTINAAYAKVHREEQPAKEHEAMAQAAASLTVEKERDLSSVFDLRHCSCRELFASGITPDAVITDPPYPEEFLPVYGLVLCPGGFEGERILR